MLLVKLLIEYEIMKKFDKEYQTQYVKEMKYLQSLGINYVFVKIELI